MTLSNSHLSNGEIAQDFLGTTGDRENTSFPINPFNMVAADHPWRGA